MLKFSNICLKFSNISFKYYSYVEAEGLFIFCIFLKKTSKQSKEKRPNL